VTTKTGTSNITRSLRMTALVAAATAALAGAGVAASTASAADESKAFAPTAHNATMRDVAKQVLAVGAPGYTARIDNGDRVAITAAGLADRATRRPLTGHEQFEVGSNTKTFTATR
jgi:D-alanyl-D-alanine carboxypeptidase